jgi:ubiquinone/menaquinone biosynthesis C-methylase UbiE
MGFYATHVFPRVMDWLMSGPEFEALRRTALADAQGDVLEIGFGTGLNLQHYPGTVTSLTAIDPAEHLPARIADRVAAAPVPVAFAALDAERLPFDTGRFDAVVSTWTLCTIPDARGAAREVARVLKPGGRYLFLEHGRSDDARIARWQDRFNPVQRFIACGCNINRRIDQLIADAGLALTELERFRMAGVPRVAGEMYRGVATSAA